jgi:Replication initiator protein, pSAM2
VHTRRQQASGRPARCRPRRKHATCPHGRRTSCGLRHKETDPCLGRPLCGDCYDYHGAVVWNAHAPELWRRTTIAIRRHLAKTAQAAGAGTVQLSYAKVAEFQARGLVHFHAIFRRDTTTDAGQLAPLSLGVGQLTAAITAAASTWFATVAHPSRANGWDIRWGAQLDIRTVRIPASGQPANIAVAAYLAKYATKSTEAVGTVACRITADNLTYYGNPRSHQGRLIRAAWHLGSHTASGFEALRRWAHMTQPRVARTVRKGLRWTTRTSPRTSRWRTGPERRTLTRLVRTRMKSTSRRSLPTRPVLRR